MNSCDNKPADSLVAGTFLGIDCEGNPVGAGGSIATCKDLQDAKDANNDAVKDAVDAAKADLADAIAQEKQERKDADAQEKAERKEADAGIKADLAQEVADRKQADKELRNETKIKAVKRDGDMAIIEMIDGSQYPFSVKDSVFGADRPVNFAPSANGDNIEITLADGSVLDMTRQEFAEWLAGKDSPIATDEEVRKAVLAGKNEVLDKLNKLAADINYDQATLKYVHDEAKKTAQLLLENEDKSKHSVNLVSPDRGNLLEARNNGLYYGVEAPANLANLYVDAELGDDSLDPKEGGGSQAKPFKTLNRALAVTPQDNSSTIHLKAVTSEGLPQEYVLGRNASVTQKAVRTITAYGEQPYIDEDEVKDILTRSHYFSRANTTKFVRPRIRFDGRKYYKSPYGDYQALYRVSSNASGGTISFNSVRLYLDDPKFPDLPYDPGANFISSNIDMKFSAVEIEATDNTKIGIQIVGDGSSRSISISNTVFINYDKSSMFYMWYGSFGFESKALNGVATTQGLTGGEKPYDYPFIGNNTVPILQKDGVISGIARDILGVPTNVTSNFNLTKGSASGGGVDLSSVNNQIAQLTKQLQNLQEKVNNLPTDGDSGTGGTRVDPSNNKPIIAKFRVDVDHETKDVQGSADSNDRTIDVYTAHAVDEETGDRLQTTKELTAFSAYLNALELGTYLTSKGITPSSDKYRLESVGSGSLVAGLGKTPHNIFAKKSTASSGLVGYIYVYAD